MLFLCIFLMLILWFTVSVYYGFAHAKGYSKINIVVRLLLFPPQYVVLLLLTKLTRRTKKMKKILYTCYKVDDESALRTKFPPVHPNTFYHHCTMEFKPQDGVANVPYALKIVGRLITDMVDCLIVDRNSYYGKNEYPHITLSTADGVKPSQCNEELKKAYQKIGNMFKKIEMFPSPIIVQCTTTNVY